MRPTRPVGWPASWVRTRALTTLIALLTLVYGCAWAMVIGGVGRTVTPDGSSAADPSTLVVVGLLVATGLAMVGVGLSASGARSRRIIGWAVQAIATAVLGVALIGSITA